MVFQDSTNLNNISKYIVDANGDTPYLTIQSGIDAANIAGGNATVYIRHGTFTEDLTLRDTVFIEGQTESGTIIVGMHTPPDSGIINIRKVTIGRDCYIGMNCRILYSADVMEGSVIGSGSVVVRTIPPFSVAVGVPAKAIKQRGD